MWTTPLALMGAISTLMVCAIALAIGSPRERWGAVFVLGDYILSNLPGLFTRDFVALRFLLPGILCLIGLLSLCWKARHPWPLWALGAQLAGVATQIITLTRPEVMTWTFLTVQAASGYGVLLALLVGTLAMARYRYAERQNSKK